MSADQITEQSVGDLISLCLQKKNIVGQQVACKAQVLWACLAKQCCLLSCRKNAQASKGKIQNYCLHSLILCNSAGEGSQVWGLN